MKVRALKQFNDLTEMKFRRKNDEFSVTEKRFEQINSTSFGLLIEAIEEKEETSTKPKRNYKKRGG